MRQLLLYFLCLVLFMGCRDEDSIHSLDPSTKSKPTGEELFRAIFLIEGNLSKKIDAYQPMIESFSKRSKEDPSFDVKRRSFNEKLVELVKETDPRYFEGLRTAIESKNIRAIEKKLSDGSNIIFHHLKSMSVNNAIRLSQRHEAMALWPVAVVAAAVWEVGALVNVAAIVTFSVAVSAVFWVYPKQYMEMELSNLSDREKELIKKTDTEKELYLKNIASLLP